MTEAGGCLKYLRKYLSKTDKQNYIRISIDNEKKGSYTSNSTYIHNKNDFIWYPKGIQEKGTEALCKTSWWAMCNIKLNVTCNATVSRVIYRFHFFSIFTIPLELGVAKNISLDSETNDNGLFGTCISYQVCYNKEGLPNWRQHSANKSFVINNLQ